MRPFTPFEAPAPGPLLPGVVPAGRLAEPVLAVDQIQGNVVPGFSKDHQALLFLRVDEPEAFRAWLAALIPAVSTTEEVLAFNRLYKSLRSRQGREVATVQATWTNVAFSFAGLKKLERPGMELDAFADEAFRAGMLARATAGVLGDPTGSATAGDPARWVIGGPDEEADVVILVAADRADARDDRVALVTTSLDPRSDATGARVISGATLITLQRGDNLVGPLLAGHEHFGFRDGVSQPGVRGLLADGSPLTPSQNPLKCDQGKPGQDLLWPGEFVFGYPGQGPTGEVADPGPDPLDRPGRQAPEFARDGSFLVFRRLNQEVGAFHRFLNGLGTRFGIDPDLVGARMVGRWPSGEPVVRSPTADDPLAAPDDCRNNYFEFGEPENAVEGAAAEDAALPPCPRASFCPVMGPPPTDPTGARIPFASHIRKAYPRDDTSATKPDLGESTTQTHRMLRRGIPFGPQSASTPAAPRDDAVDRGLLFLAYQTSIVDQFEFVQASWCNDPDFKEPGSGFDPIIGQNGTSSTRRRTFRLNLPGETEPIEADRDWVVPTGGGYFFAPSIRALTLLAGKDA